jgi:nucleotide-binding universal stress UspA family protein
MIEKQAIFPHILVPIDGSQSSVKAGKLAIKLAASEGAHISFLYVVDGNIVSQLANASGRIAEQAERELEISGQHYLDYLTQLAIKADLQTNHFLLHGVPSTEIEKLAKQINANLIVIPRMGHQGPRRILIGSVTERVIEFASCPVLVVK